MKKIVFHRWVQFTLLLVVVTGVAVWFAPVSWATDTLLQVQNSDIIRGSGIVTQKTFGETILTMVNYFIGFLGFLTTLSFIYAGVLWVLNMGNDELIAKSKKIMTYSSLGIVVIILSFSAVRFITQSADTETPRGSGAVCQSDFDCTSGELCKIDPVDGGASCQAGDCRISVQCPLGKACYNNACVDPKTITQLTGGCFNAEDCDIQSGQVCWNNICQRPPDRPRAPLECLASFQCQQGKFCSGGRCQLGGNDTRCTTNTDCRTPSTCDPTGFCRNPNAGSNTSCTDNTDCSSGHVCNLSFKRCEFQGEGGAGGGGVSGSPATAASEQNLGTIDGLLATLDNSLQHMTEDLTALPHDTQQKIRDILSGQGSIADKISRLTDLLQSTQDNSIAQVLERLIAALTSLVSVRDEVDKLKTNMPESTETLNAWNDTSSALNNLVDDPSSSIKLRLFETKYRELKDLIRRFPVVQARINAAPAEGNVPFTVTFDGLDSVDPTGGTISDYRWSMLDNQGNEVSLGSDPVIVHEFTEPNTYAVRLQVATSRRDANNYKTASDGVSVVRIKANPPASQVRFRINGAEASDVYRLTLKEAQAGVTFDPSSTVPAIGRTIEKYEWFFGDTATETRSTPTVVVHGYPKAGEFFVKLVVTDNHGVKDQSIVKLLVNSLAADISVTPRQGNVNTQYQFKGVTSRSDDGAIVSYAWSIEDDKGQKLFDTDEQTFFYKFDHPGEYHINLLVSDITGARNNATKTLKVVSRKPVASFTHSVAESNHPNRLKFDAAGSYDPDEGDVLKYSWDFDGDGTFDVVNSSESRVTYDYKKAGNFKAKLQVQDSFGEKDLAEDTISINSTLGADIVLAESAVQAGQEVSFVVKSDSAVSYLWEFGDGETASSSESTVKHTYHRKGRFTVRLHFFDSRDNEGVDTATLLVGNSDTPLATVRVLVNDLLSEPVQDLCGAGKTGFSVTRADTVLFSGKDSINTDGSTRLLAYDWKFSDGATHDKKEFSRRFNDLSQPGKCIEATLTVRDTLSGKGSDPETIDIQVANALPTLTDFVVETDPNVKTLVTPTTAHLRAVNAHDTDGTIKRYKWWYVREGDKASKLGIHTTTVPETDLVITAVGQPNLKNKYHFVVEIMDSDGGVYNSDARFAEVNTLEITNGPNLSPVTDFTLDKTAISAGDTISFVSQSYDPQGDRLPPTAFAWDFDGDGQFDDLSSGSQVSRQYNTPGSYNVRLKVTYRGLTSSATKTIFVAPTQSLPQAAFRYTAQGTTVTFDSSNSRFDPNLKDTKLRFEWDFDVKTDADGNGINDDDVQSTEANPTFTFARAGVYRVRLKVKDSLGMEGIVVRDVDLTLTNVQREQNSFHSLPITAPDSPLTKLNVTVSPAPLSRGGTADVTVNVFNADNSPYTGKVFFEVIEGAGEFTPNAVDAKDGKAASIFSATDAGPVRVRVRATDTIYGDLTEEAAFTVSP